MQTYTYPTSTERGQRVIDAFKRVAELVGGCAITGVSYLAMVGDLQAKFIDEDDLAHPFDLSLDQNEGATSNEQ